MSMIHVEGLNPAASIRPSDAAGAGSYQLTSSVRLVS
jgi:hypothetical protein